MTKTNQVLKKSAEELVDAFAEAACTYDQAIDKGDSKRADECSLLIAEIYRELRNRGTEEQRMLLRLLKDDRIGVRVAAAGRALEFAPDDAERVLLAVQESPEFGLHKTEARMTLSEWKAGRLKFI